MVENYAIVGFNRKHDALMNYYLENLSSDVLWKLKLNFDLLSHRKIILWLMYWRNGIMEKIIMSEDIIASFSCYGKYMVVAKLEHGTHVIPYEEWKRIYGQLHPELWKNGKRIKNERLA